MIHLYIQVYPTILFYPCLNRKDSWWIPGNEGPIVVPAAIFHLHSWIIWRLIKSGDFQIYFSCPFSASVIRCFLFAEMSVWVRFFYCKYLNDLWYEKKTYIYRLSQPTAFNSALFRYERYIVCPKKRACQGRDHNFKWNVQRPHRNSPQKVSALQW